MTESVVLARSLFGSHVLYIFTIFFFRSAPDDDKEDADEKEDQLTESANLTESVNPILFFRRSVVLIFFFRLAGSPLRGLHIQKVALFIKS